MKKYLDDQALETVVGGLTFAVGVINDKNGVNLVTAPPAAIPGVMNAFTNILIEQQRDLANIQLVSL